jgi:hypothetical protein
MVDRNVQDAAVGYRAILAIDENGDAGEVICNPSPMGEANAGLIAAAPDLLAALQSVCRCLEWHEKRHGVGMDAKALEDAREAIAKATGGAP